MYLNNYKFLLFEKRKSAFHWLLLLTVVFLSNSLSIFAQEIKISARLDTNAIKIGDQVHLNLEIQHLKNTKVQWPSIPDSFTKVEVFKRTPVDTIKSDNGVITEKQVINLIGFDPGSYTIPSFLFIYKTSNDTSSKSARTDSLLLVVKDIPVDTSKAIKDIKPPMEIPFSWKEALPYLIGGAAIIVVALAIYCFIKNRKKQPAKEHAAISKRPAYDIALESLKNLESEKLWQQGNIKLFHSRLSDIMRIYLEDRYQTNAMEHTTEEILQSLQSILNGENKEKLKQVLILADLVKFAKAQPIGIENEMSLRNAFDFVNNTKPETTENSIRKEEPNL